MVPSTTKLNHSHGAIKETVSNNKIFFPPKNGNGTFLGNSGLLLTFKSCSQRASALTFLNRSRIHLNFVTSVDTVLGVNNAMETYVFLSSINASVNMRVNADAWCE